MEKGLFILFSERGARMIRLEVELKDDKFIYNYEVGSSKYSSNCEVHSDMLKAFTDIMNHCFNVTVGNNKEFKEEITAQAWMQRNPEAAKSFLEDHDARTK